MIADLIFWDFRDDLQDYLAWVICVAALIWGGGPERAVAITWLVLFELAPGVYDLIDPSMHFRGRVDAFVASMDILAAAAWIMIALYANRNYTLWIAAMQILAVAAHLASAIADPISIHGYAVMAVAPSWMQLSLLSIGLTRHLLRKRKFGDYRDWRISKYADRSGPQSNYGHMLATMLSSNRSTWRDGLK